MKKGEIYEGTVQDVLFPDKAVVVTESGESALVKYAILGQKVRFRVNKRRKDKTEGILLNVIGQAPDEVSPACEVAGKCGGCIYQTLPYEKQLAIKERQVKKLLDGGGSDCAFEGIVPCPVRFGYRNKMELTFGDEYKGGPLALGMHQRGSFYDIAGIQSCVIMTADMKKAANTVLRHFLELGIPFYHRLRHEGVLRHLLLRQSASTKELLVALVTSSQYGAKSECPGVLENTGEGASLPGFVSDAGCVSGDKASEYLHLGELTEKLTGLELEGSITGILHIVNDSVADIIQSDSMTLLYGRDWITENILGLSFRVTVFSFFQTNTKGAELLYQTVRDYIGEIDGKNVFDLYSGTGTIAQVLAPVAGHVTGVEIVKEAVEAARINAAQNGLSNCRFIAGDVLKVLDELTEKPDLIVLDPPRDGIHPRALPKIIAYGVPAIVYVSCKLTSLVRDRQVLESAGYRMVKAKAVDMFPATGGIETVAFFVKNGTECEKT